jgi:hypothetical protein
MQGLPFVPTCRCGIREDPNLADGGRKSELNPGVAPTTAPPDKPGLSTWLCASAIIKDQLKNPAKIQRNGFRIFLPDDAAQNRSMQVLHSAILKPDFAHA